MGGLTEVLPFGLLCGVKSFDHPKPGIKGKVRALFRMLRRMRKAALTKPTQQISCALAVYFALPHISLARLLSPPPLTAVT